MKPFHLAPLHVNSPGGIRPLDRLWLATHQYTHRTAIGKTPSMALESLLTILRGQRKRSDSYYINLGYSRKLP
jgi:hypothetical protein